MLEPFILPPIFVELIENADNLAALDEKTWEEFFCLLGEDETLLPELVAVLGPQNFMVLVQYFGGQTIRLPRAGEILKRVHNDLP
jgi:hypothetical protein